VLGQHRFAPLIIPSGLPENIFVKVSYVSNGVFLRFSAFFVNHLTLQKI